VTTFGYTVVSHGIVSLINLIWLGAFLLINFIKVSECSVHY